MAETGFFRVMYIKDSQGNMIYRYQVRNRLVNKQLSNKSILKLKRKVQQAELLWGIYNEELAKKHSRPYDLKTLQGRYGYRE